MNNQRFLPHDYSGGPPIQSYVQVEWQYVSLRPETQFYEVKRSIIQREDNLFMAIGGLTNKQDSFFEIEKVASQALIGKNRFGILKQQINLTLDAHVISRSVYNFLTLLGDVGGFYGIVAAFFAILNNALSYNKAENLFAQTLY